VDFTTDKDFHLSLKFYSLFTYFSTFAVNSQWFLFTKRFFCVKMFLKKAFARFL